MEPALQSHTRCSYYPVPPHVQLTEQLGLGFQRELGDKVSISLTSFSHALPLMVLSTGHTTHKIPLFGNRTGPCQKMISFYFWSTQHHWHMDIKAASPDQFPYLYHKQCQYIPVQLICDFQNHLLNVIARLPIHTFYRTAL